MTLIRGEKEGPPVVFATPPAGGVVEPAPTIAPATGGGSETVAPPQNSLIRGEREGAPVAFNGPPQGQGFAFPSVAETRNEIAPDVSGLTPEADPLGEQAFLSTPQAGTEFSASQSSKEANKLALMLSDLFVNDPQQVAAIIEENDPNAKITRNEQNQATHVTVNGRTMPLNAPGISGRDIGALIGPTAAFIVTRGVGSKLIGGATRGFLANTGLSAAAGGGEAAIRRGVEAGVGGREFTEDLGSDIALGVAAGGAGETLGRGVAAGLRLGGKALAPLLQRAGINRGVQIADANGVLNAEGQRLARVAGVDAEIITPTMARQIQADIDKLTPGIIARAGEAAPRVPRGVPFRGAIQRGLGAAAERRAAPTNVAINRAFAEGAQIPSTTGGLGGVQKQLAQEFNAQGRTFSGSPLRGRQIEAGEGLERIAQGRAGLDVTAEAQATNISQAVRDAGEQARAGADAVYESIKSRIVAGTRLDLGTSTLRSEVVRPLGRQGFPDVDFAGLPKANAARKFLRRFARRHAGRPDVKFADVEAARRSINSKWIKNTRDPAELHALSRVVETLDNWVEGVRRTNNFTGDPSLLADTLTARGLWSQFRQTFSSRAAGETVVRDLARGSTSAVGAVNRFFSPTTGPAAIRQLARATGRGSEAMQEIRRAAWRKLLANSSGEPKSIAQANKSVAEAINQKAEVFREAMGPSEFRRLRRLGVALKNAARQPKVKQKTNPVSDAIRQILAGLALSRSASVIGAGGAGAVPGAVAGGALMGTGAALAGAVGVPAAVLTKRGVQNAISAAGAGTPARGLLETPAAALAQQGLLSPGRR